MNSGQFNGRAQLIVALIAALSALLLAIVQYVTQRRNSRAIEELKVRLDRQRTEHAEYLKAYLNLLIDGKEQQLNAFKTLLQHVQLFRDRVRRFLAEPQSYDKRLIANEIKQQSDAILLAYSEGQVHLDEFNRKRAHSIKTLCARMAARFDTFLTPDESEAMTMVEIEALRRTEEQLSKLQAELREDALKVNAALVDSLLHQSSKEH